MNEYNANSDPGGLELVQVLSATAVPCEFRADRLEELLSLLELEDEPALEPVRRRPLPE